MVLAIVGYSGHCCRQLLQYIAFSARLFIALSNFPGTRTRQSILEKYGKSTFDYFKVWQDKSFFFSPSHESFISYRMVSGVAFCLADPVGPDGDREQLIQAFLNFCTENGWLAVVMMPDDPSIYTQTWSFTAQSRRGGNS